jgi:phage shock protein PspC (stress-responsive transcriptional regulator)
MDEQQSGRKQKARKLYKSTSDRMIDGVCSGIADYLDTDPTVVRLTLVAFTILSFGAGVVFYIVAMIVMPMKPPSLSGSAESSPETSRKKGSDAGIMTGVVIFIIGIILLFYHYNISLPWFGIFDLRLMGQFALPIILILIGSLLLMGRERETEEDTGVKESSQADEFSSGLREPSEKKRLFRSIRDVKVAGVCGGLAEYLGIDSTLVRLGVVLLALASFGVAMILYFVCALVIPKEKI